MRILFWLGVSIALTAAFSTALAQVAPVDAATATVEPTAASSEAATPVASPSSDSASTGAGVEQPRPAAGANPTQSTDEPDAIGNLIPPIGDGASADAGTGQPTSDVGNRIALAVHQLDQKEYADADRVLTGVVAELELSTSRYDPALVGPLTLLGDALNGETKYKEALRNYEQARHIARITTGLHTPDQVEILYREANALAAMGKLAKATDREEYAYETLLRHYGPFSPSLVPGIYHLAEWYNRTANVFAARGLYERAVDILARAHGETDPSLIPALRGLAESYKEERFPPFAMPENGHAGAPLPSNAFESQAVPVAIVNRFGAGEIALVEIVKILSADPNAKPLDVALAEIDLADWYLLFDKEVRAVPVYVHARQIMRERAGMSDAEIAAYFGQPTALYLPLPDDPAAPPEALRTNPTQGYVELGYTVAADGTVADLKTVASIPEGLMDMKVRRAVRIARFRPTFAGDTPVAAPNQVYRHTYTYYPRPDSPASGKTTGKDEAAPAPTG
jgi:TonB family protein